MTIHNHLTGALFFAVVLGMGLALPSHGTEFPDPCPAETHISGDKVVPLFIAAFQGCRSLGYQDGCTVLTRFGQTECFIDGRKVELSLTDFGRKLESWNSPNLSIQRVLIRKKIGLAACSYNYNPMDNGDGGNMGPFSRRIANVTFCTDPQQTVAKELAPTPGPISNAAPSIFDKLGQALGRPVVYAVFNSVIAGEPPFIIGAPGAEVTPCDTAVESPDSCFRNRNPSIPNEFREILDGNSQYIVRKRGSDCAVHCFEIDGIKSCKEVCLSH